MPVLVGVDGRDRFHVRLATAPSREHSGPSLAEILDDLALEVMESVPKASPAAMARYAALCPDLQLRRVKVTATLPLLGGKPVTWTGRLSVVVERWPGDDLRIATVPRLGAVRFPIARAGELEAALPELLVAEAPRHSSTAWVDAAVARQDEHLEILEVDVDAPTVLSSRRPVKRKRAAVEAQPEPEKSDRTWVPPATLRSVAVSLAHRRLDGSLAPAFGRDALVERIVRELRRPGAAVLLVGPSGVGKTAVIHEVVRRMVDPDAPLTERLDLWQLDGNRLIAGMSFVGAWERRVELLVAELKARDDVLVVDDLPTLVWTGRSAHTDTHVAGFLEPYLGRGELRILGECTPERLAASRDEAPGFFDRFRVFQVPPLDERETLLVALRIARELEVLARYGSIEGLPGSGLALVEQMIKGNPRTRLARGHAIEAFARASGLPIAVIDPERRLDEGEVRSWFERRVVGQPEAVRRLTELVLVLKAGLGDPGRPLGSLLLLGPTGVGKTESAKALATWLFGSPDRLVRFDMSEFGGWGAARRLVDGPGGQGLLTKRVREQPFGIVLFDEIEKAEPAVFDVLLQVLGEGRLTDGTGSTVSFRHTIVLLTSNLGATEPPSVGLVPPPDAAEALRYRRAAEAFFRPEFVNRLDVLLPYRPLSRDAVREIARGLLASALAREGLSRRDVAVTWGEELLDHLIAVGYEPKYGARPMKRAIEVEVLAPLARVLARGDHGQALRLGVREGRVEVG
jgi:ATP-dependent Clp protease ATP-binding subunit ClpC